MLIWLNRAVHTLRQEDQPRPLSLTPLLATAVWDPLKKCVGRSCRWLANRFPTKNHCGLGFIHNIQRWYSYYPVLSKHYLGLEFGTFLWGVLTSNPEKCSLWTALFLTQRRCRGVVVPDGSTQVCCLRELGALAWHCFQGWQNLGCWKCCRPPNFFV